MADLYTEPRRYSSKEQARLDKITKALAAKRVKGKHALKVKRERNKIKAAGRARVAGGDPTAPRTAGDIRREADSATNLRYGDEERSLNAELGVSDQMQLNIGNWYQDYLNQVQSARDNAATAFQGAQQRLQEATNASQTAFNQNQQQINDQAAQSAALRGASVDPTLAATANQAQYANRAGADQFSGLIGTLGANTTANFDARKAIGAGERTAQQLLESRRKSSTQQKLRDLLGEKGDYRVQQIAASRDAERKAKLEAAAFGADVATSTAKLAGDAADRRAKARDTRHDNANADKKLAWDMSPNNPKNQKKGKGGKPSSGIGSATPAQVRKTVDTVNKAKYWAARYKKSGWTEQQVREALLGGHKDEASGTTSPNYDTYVVNAAMDLAFNGKLSRPNVKSLHRRGVRLKGTGWKY